MLFRYRHRVRVTRQRVIIAAVVLVVVVGGGVATWLATRPAPAAAPGLATATTTTLRQTVSSSGTIEPAQQDNLNFAVSGQVTAVNVGAGQQVTAGQPLATMNSASLSASVAEAQASLAADQSRLSADQGNGGSSAQVTADQAAVTAAQNQVADAQNALSEATLTSPIAGTVASVNLTVGQQVSGGGSGSTGSAGGSGAGAASGSGGTGSAGGSAGSSSGSSATAQVVVISNGAYVVNASVDDTEVGQVKNGDQAVITPDGSTTPTYGTVTSVALLATSSASVPSYPITIGVTGSPTGLFPGASASVSIIVKQLSNVLVVPSAAIHYTGGKAAVYQLSGGQQVTRGVTVSVTVGGRTEILTGLADGDQVVVPDGSSTGGRGGGGGGGRTGGGGFGGGGLTGGGGLRGGGTGG